MCVVCGCMQRVRVCSARPPPRWRRAPRGRVRPRSIPRPRPRGCERRAGPAGGCTGRPQRCGLTSRPRSGARPRPPGPAPPELPLQPGLSPAPLRNRPRGRKLAARVPALGPQVTQVGAGSLPPPASLFTLGPWGFLLFLLSSAMGFNCSSLTSFSLWSAGRRPVCISPGPQFLEAGHDIVSSGYVQAQALFY